MIYLSSVALSCLCFFFSGRSKGSLSRLFFVLGFSIPCLLAALRGDGVGTDVQVYALEMLESAKGISIADYFEHVKYANSPGFALVAWLSANFLGGRFTFLFLIECLTILPVLIRLRQSNNRLMWVGAWAYLIIFWPLSLNMMKQSIAISIAFFSLKYVFERRKIAFCLVILIAISFHLTAIIALAFYPIGNTLIRATYANQAASLLERKPDMRTLVWGLMIGVFVALFAFGEQIVLAVSSVRPAYAYQVQHIGEGGPSYSVIFLWIVTMLSLVGISPATKTPYRGNSEIAVLLLLTTAGCLGLQLDIISDSVGRLGYYGLVSMPLLLQLAAQMRKKVDMFTIIPLACCVVYFLYTTILQEYNGVYPYYLY